MVLDQRVISSACGKYVSSLVVVKALEENPTMIEFVVEAAQRADVQLTCDVELLGIGDDRVQMIEDRSTPTVKVRIGKDETDPSECLFRSVYLVSAYGSR